MYKIRFSPQGKPGQSCLVINEIFWKIIFGKG